jgi:hypothetical protein
VEKILRLLTAEQQAAWKNLVGAPFVETLRGGGPPDRRRPLD